MGYLQNDRIRMALSEELVRLGPWERHIFMLLTTSSVFWFWAALECFCFTEIDHALDVGTANPHMSLLNTISLVAIVALFTA